jgi:hypothetical protein
MAYLPINITQCLEALNISDYALDGNPTSESEFNSMFRKITSYDNDDLAVFSTNPSDFGVTWSQISAKLTELNNAEPMRVLRAERDILIAETDWWASSDLTMTTAQTNYRQALRDITTQTPSLDDDGNITGITWPTKP